MHVMRQAFQDDPDDFRDIIDCSINCIMRALLTRINRDPSFDRKMYYDGMFNAEYKDDAQWKLHQEVAPDVHPEWFNRNQ
jgi:hypothetical protein